MNMDYSNEYTAYSRENLMQKIQMRMSEQRFKHVLGVEETAVALAKKYGASPEKASIAALTHDYAKERPDEEFKMVIVRDGFDPELLNYNNAIWHGLVGASFVERELGITDAEILHAIRVHTTGAAKMSLLDKIIDLDEAVAFETKHTLAHLLAQEQQIYPKTIETYNYWVAKK